MEKIIYLPDEEWDDETRDMLFAWVEALMRMPENQIRLLIAKEPDPVRREKIIEYLKTVPPSGIEPESKV